MKSFVYCCMFLLCAMSSFAQLGPMLGSQTLPQPLAPICEIEPYLGSQYITGFEVDEVVNNFSLWSTNDVRFVLSDQLAQGEHVLLVNGSFTCPRFREKVGMINLMAQTYTDLKVVVVYTVEAHPQDVASPYFDWINVTPSNIQDGVLYDQPTTYQERKDIALDMIAFTGLQVPVLLDDPCNQWWETFGPAANNSYVISPDGTVESFHGWFDRAPDEIACDLAAIMEQTGPCYDVEEEEEEEIGEFSFQNPSNSEEGEAGQILTIQSVLRNESEFPVTITIEREEENIPDDWQTAICLDVCLSPNVSSAQLVLEPGQMQAFIMYFYTAAEVAATGDTYMRFTNSEDPENSFVQSYFATANYEEPDEVDLGDEEALEQALSLNEIDGDQIQLFPNPAKHTFNIEAPGVYQVEVYNALGQAVYAERNATGLITLSPTYWESGLYFVKVKAQNDSKTLRLFYQN